MLYEVDGHFIDDGDEFYGYIVKDSLDVVEEEDEHIFYYFQHLNELVCAVESGEPVDDFVFTAYRPCSDPCQSCAKEEKSNADVCGKC